MCSESIALPLSLLFLFVFLIGVIFILACNIHIAKEFENDSVESQYGILGGVWEWKSQDLKGYVVGLDVDDGCAGYMELLDDDGDISGVYVLVDLSCLTRVDG